MTQLRPEFLAWCKTRALEYVEAGDLPRALASMTSDLTKWDGPAPLYDPDLFKTLMADGMLFASQSTDGMRHWIEGFA